MISEKLKNCILRSEWLFVALLIILGAVLRLAALDTLPPGLNQDEASAGYEAWTLLNYGVDRNGVSWPALFISWGSGQNVLYSYLSIPIIAIFGLSVWSVRLLAGVMGTLCLVVFWLLARRLRGPAFGLTALLFLCVNPWHIMASRWALESNLLPTLLLLGIYLTIVSAERPWALIVAALVFGLSLYAYGTAFIFLPFFLIFAVIWLTRRRLVRTWYFIAALALFFAVALPITLCNIINIAGSGQGANLFGLTLPLLTETRQASVTIFGGNVGPIKNFSDFLTLLVTQSDGLIFNAMPGYGLYYFFGLPLAFIGLMASLGSRRDRPNEVPMLLALLACFISAFVIKININRMNMVMLPMMYFASLGLYWIMQRLKNFAALPVCALILCFALSLRAYATEFPQKSSRGFFDGLGESIEYAMELSSEELYISNYAQQPYIFALFYSQTPPEEFYNTVSYMNPDGAFRWPYGFSGFRFGYGAASGEGLMVLHYSETENVEILATFGDYCVCENYV